MIHNSIRVLLADDSAVTRRLIAEAMATDSELELVGMGRHGGEVLQLLPVHRPDVILLDVEMPIMDGVETVTAIRKVDPQVPIVMFSSLTCAGATATLDALAAGANDYAAKPVKLGHASEAVAYIRNELLPKVKMWGRRQRLRRSAPVPKRSVDLSRFSGLTPSNISTTGVASSFVGLKKNASTTAGPVDIIAIGVSTGGPNALAEVLGRLPADFPVPIVIVQHMPAVFTQLLASRLDSICPLAVREATQGEVIQPGGVWIAPGNFHMTVKNQKADRVVDISQGPHENSCRPAVDPLFRSVAAVYGSRCLGVILTGMGRDGEEGCRAINRASGQIVVQDEASSTVWGMPRAVALAGLANEILPLGRIAQELADRTRRETIQKMAALSAARQVS